MSGSVETGRVAQGPLNRDGVSGTPRPVRGSKSRVSGERVTEPSRLGGPCDTPRPPRAKPLMNSPG